MFRLSCKNISESTCKSHMIRYNAPNGPKPNSLFLFKLCEFLSPALWNQHRKYSWHWLWWKTYKETLVLICHLTPALIDARAPSDFGETRAGAELQFCAPQKALTSLLISANVRLPKSAACLTRRHFKRCSRRGVTSRPLVGIRTRSTRDVTPC